MLSRAPCSITDTQIINDQYFDSHYKINICNYNCMTDTATEMGNEMITYPKVKTQSLLAG